MRGVGILLPFPVGGVLRVEVDGDAETVRGEAGLARDPAPVEAAVGDEQGLQAGVLRCCGFEFRGHAAESRSCAAIL